MCFMIKVIIGHVVKELVTNPVNGLNELVPDLLRDKAHKRYSRQPRISCVE